MFHVLAFHKNLSRVLINSVFFLLILLFFVKSGSSETVKNYGGWQNFSSISKTLYTAGAIDSLISPWCEGCDNESFIQNFQTCLRDLRITTVEIVTMIDNFYLNSKNWQFTPQDAIKYQLINGHCYQYVSKSF